MSKPNGKKRFGVNPLLSSMIDALNIQHGGKAKPAPEQQETQIQIVYKPGAVRIVFSNAITWVNFTPEGAEEMAKHLIELAQLAKEPDPEESRILVPGGKF